MKIQKHWITYNQKKAQGVFYKPLVPKLFRFDFHKQYLYSQYQEFSFKPSQKTLNTVKESPELNNLLILLPFELPSSIYYKDLFEQNIFSQLTLCDFIVIIPNDIEKFK